jgi:hypothetical protein
MSSYPTQNSSDSEGGVRICGASRQWQGRRVYQPCYDTQRRTDATDASGQDGTILADSCGSQASWGSQPSFFNLQAFIKDLAPLVPFISKIQIGLREACTGVGYDTENWPLYVLTTLLQRLDGRGRPRHPEVTSM